MKATLNILFSVAAKEKKQLLFQGFLHIQTNETNSTILFCHAKQ